MALTVDKGATSPKKKDNQNGNVEKKTSALGRELGNLYVMKQAQMLYNGLKTTNRWTGDLASKVEDKATSLCQDIITTKVGKKADESLASAAATTIKIAECFVCRQDKEDLCHHSTVSRMLMKAFHLSFRFCLPLMLFRWSVDIGLIFTELALALTKDFVRSGVISTTSRARVEGFGPSDDDTTVEGRANREDAEDETVNKALDVVDSFFFASWWDIFTYFLSLIYYMAKFAAIFFVIPMLSYQWYFLNALSSLLHRLAGLDYDNSEMDDGALQRPTLGQADAPPVPRKWSPGKWQADAVLSRVLSHLLDFPLLGLVLEMIGVKRQFNLFRRMQKAFKGNIGLLTVQEGRVPPGLMAIMTDIGNVLDGNLPPYLNLDYTYNEDEDSDYEPGESTDSSLGYSEDDLDATSRKDGNAQVSSQHGRSYDKRNMAGLIKQNVALSPRKRRDTVSQNDQEAPVITSCVPDTSPRERVPDGNSSGRPVFKEHMQEARSAKEMACQTLENDIAEAGSQTCAEDSSVKAVGTGMMIPKAEDQQKEDVSLSPRRRQRRQAFLFCIERLVSPEFARDLDLSLKWAEMDTDGIQKVTSVLKIDQDREMVESSAMGTSQEIEKQTSEFECSDIPAVKREVVDPDIAALLASGTPLDTVSVRADEMIAFKMGGDIDPAEHPLPPSPVPTLSPMGRMRQKSWRDQRSSRHGKHAVDTINEEDEQVWTDEMRGNGAKSETSEATISELTEHSVFEIREDPNVKQVASGQQSSQDGDLIVKNNLRKETGYVTGKSSIKPDINVSSPLVMNGNEARNLDRDLPKEENNDQQILQLDEAHGNKNIVGSSTQNGTKIERGNLATGPNHWTVQVSLPDEVFQDISAPKNAEKNRDALSTPDAKEPVLFRSPKGCYFVAESVSSPVSSLSSMSSYDEGESRGSETHNPTPKSATGAQGTDLGRSETCTDVDTGLPASLKE